MLQWNHPEKTVLETLRCPGCSTRYVIAPVRVRPGIRRAKCFRCSSVFGIEEAVARLLAPVQDPAGQEMPVPVAGGQQDPVPAAGADQASPFLNLDDLAGAAEATLHIPVPVPDFGAYPEEPGSGNGTTYLSAKDAIEKLLGRTPAPAAPVRMGSRGAMDVEATLSALDTTLGGAAAAEPARTLVVPSSMAAPPAPQAEAEQSAPIPPKSDLATTVKLTREEIRAALAPPPAEPAAAKAPEQPRQAPPAPEVPAPGIPALPAAEAEGTPAPDLLKIQLEQETCNNVTVEQMTAWIEQGRVHEYHMVARQYSEHWIEASKVPSLRPVFDRMRKARSAQEEEPAKPAPEPAPVKRGLFSGLFGRN